MNNSKEEPMSPCVVVKRKTKKKNHSEKRGFDKQDTKTFIPTQPRPKLLSVSKFQRYYETSFRVTALKLWGFQIEFQRESESSCITLMRFCCRGFCLHIPKKFRFGDEINKLQKRHDFFQCGAGNLHLKMEEFYVLK